MTAKRKSVICIRLMVKSVNSLPKKFQRVLPHGSQLFEKKTFVVLEYGVIKRQILL